MSDYIKREDAIDAACANCIYDEFLSDRKKRIKEGITEIPPADVVEVVRCKDCEHHEELLYNNDGNVLCWVHDIDVVVDRNGYCNYGKRKEQDHD